MAYPTKPEPYSLPPAAPFHNHGVTPAGWALALGVCVGVLMGGVGLAVSQMLLVWIGIGVVVASIVVSFILHATGRGQPTRLTQTRRAGSWYKD